MATQQFLNGIKQDLHLMNFTPLYTYDVEMINASVLTIDGMLYKQLKHF
jgi:hypothetical protein